MNGREGKGRWRRDKTDRSAELSTAETQNVGGAHNLRSAQESRLKRATKKVAYIIKAAIVCIVLLALIGGCCRIVQVCTYRVFFGGMVKATIQQTVKPGALR
jgi:hypothetical protein